MPGKGVEPPYDWFLDSATPWASGLAARLDPVHGLRVEGGIPLKAHTRFAVGSPADLFAWAETPQALGIGICAPFYPLVERSNVVASEASYWGLVARYVAHGLECRYGAIEAEAGELSKRCSSLY